MLRVWYSIVHIPTVKSLHYIGISEPKYALVVNTTVLL